MYQSNKDFPLRSFWVINVADELIFRSINNWRIMMNFFIVEYYQASIEYMLLSFQLEDGLGGQ